MEAARSKGMQTKERLQVLVAVRMDVSEGLAVSDGEAENAALTCFEATQLSRRRVDVSEWVGSVLK